MEKMAMFILWLRQITPRNFISIRTKLDGTGKLELLSPSDEVGTHEYNISPEAKYAFHSFSNYKTYPAE